MREKPTIVCAHCGVSFLARWATPKITPVFCSRRCSNVSRVRVVPDLVPNPDDPTTMLVPLTRGGFSVIDKVDAEVVGKHKWRERRDKGSLTIYAMSSSGVYLHRLIENPRPDEEVDHRDHDGLNNRRGNLRKCDKSTNMLNRSGAQSNSKSGIRGVSFNKARGKWVAKMRIQNGVGIRKSFDTLEEAVAAWEAHYSAYVP